MNLYNNPIRKSKAVKEFYTICQKKKIKIHVKLNSFKIV